MYSTTIQGRDYFAYSWHASYDAACDALDEYFATGEVCEAERPLVERVKKRWAVLFPM